MADESPQPLLPGALATGGHPERTRKDRSGKRHGRKRPGKEGHSAGARNTGEGEGKRATTGRSRHSSKKDHPTQKKFNHLSEEATQKGGRPRSRGGNRRHGPKDNPGQADGKYEEARIIDDKPRRELALQREHEIEQCSHLLTTRNFKLFKRGQHVTSYGFTRNQNMLGIPNCKFVVNVPLDYPKSPIKLQHSKATAGPQSAILEEKLDRLTKNFNFKSRQMVLGGAPITSQLNYLVQKADTLCLPDYKVIDRREQEFYAKFV